MLYVKFPTIVSGAKRKLSKCGTNRMGNEPILALPEGVDDFVVNYDARSKDLEAGLEKREGLLTTNVHGYRVEWERIIKAYCCQVIKPHVSSGYDGFGYSQWDMTKYPLS
ncbi:hypothetical protein Tco_1087508 [Tanacetum coccineum]